MAGSWSRNPNRNNSNQATEERPTRSTPVNRKFNKKSSGDGGDSPFTFVTSLFLSKSGKAWTVMLKDNSFSSEIMNKLSSLQEGDGLCVNFDKNQENLILSIRRGDQNNG